MRTAKENRRYHLHRKLKTQNIICKAPSKTIYVPVGQHEGTVYGNLDIIELMVSYGYSIQLEIPLQMTTITEEQKALIKAAFGKQYTGPAIVYLNEQKIFNKENEPFTSQALKHIIGGNYENEKVVTALCSRAIEILDSKKQFEKNTAKKAKSLLK